MDAQDLGYGKDIGWLKQQGVREVFGAGADTDRMIERIGSAARH